MAFNDDQNDFPVPNNMTQRKTSNLLPKYFRTAANKKFLQATLDQVTNPGVVEKINGFVGSREAKAVTITDNYLDDVTNDRTNYQLTPFAVYKDNIGNVEFNADYLDYIGALNTYGVDTTNHSRLNEQEMYSWDPHIDFDKFSNFQNYYWVPSGPQSVPVRGQGTDIVSTLRVETVVDDDNTAFVFYPDGVTRNPKIKLYRGQTYRFEVNTPGHPFSIAVNRTFLPGQEDSTGNVSTLYNEGVTITHQNNDTLVDITDFVKEGYVEQGVFEFTVPENAPDTLYYISQYDINTSGSFLIYDIEEASEIDVEAEIIGKKTYTTVDGWKFSNGMKVYFQGNVTPAKYDNGYFFVEGVGESIQLIPVQDLEVPAIFTQDAEVPFDIHGFDRVPFSEALSYAGTKDYIVINRRDKSRNAFARYNRWFHKDVIQQSAEINNQIAFFDENLKAKRPIIEFEPNLRLYNHGNKAKENVDLIDTFTADVFSTIEGSLGYNIDGIDIVDGMRILFTGDNDSFVYGKIFQVEFITHNNRRQIALKETADTDPVENETVLIRQGTNYSGRMFWYNGTEWKLAQDKTGLNQAPKFDLFDENEISIGDEDFYPTSNFTGNRVFAYRIGEGTNDTELGFPLTYQNFVNIGDIVFDFDLLNKTYEYEIDNGVQTVKSDLLYLKKYISDVEQEFVTGWSRSNSPSEQCVVRKFTGQELTNNFPIDVYKNSGELNDLVVSVRVNNDLKFEGTDYNITSENKVAKINLTADIDFDDIVVVHTKSSASKTDLGYYEIPYNLERNPLNENITEFTLGQVNDHVAGIIEEIKDFQGLTPGASSIRDLGNLIPFGRKFVKHTGPSNLATYSLVDKSSNIVKSLRYAGIEYLKFKNIFLQKAKDLFFDGTVKDHVDFILNDINQDKNIGMPFYSSDMIGISGSKKISYTVLDERNKFYALSAVFDIDYVSRKAVYVYVNDQQLTHEKDYTFTDNGFVEISATIAKDDIIDIYEYESTEGNYVPITPSKIGMYPAYYPEKYVDNTYETPTTVVRGHDGSIVVGYEDYRDDLLVELEKRIYNNIKVKYDPNIFDIYDYVPGEFRNTGISRDQLENIMITDFAQWTRIARVLDYTDNSFVTPSNSKTFNYSKSTSPKGNVLKGFWRGVYKNAFDTDTPSLTPWHMLGLANKPSWWEDVYGPAPYTKDNLILWQDLETGTIREPGKPVTRNKKFVRPGLTSFIPVNEYGQTVSPMESSYAQEFSFTLTKNTPFIFGDQAPTETAWRRSSHYPFSLLTAILLNKPTKVIGIGFDRSRISRNKANNLVYAETNKIISTKDLVFPKVYTGEITLTCGFVNMIAEYMASNVTTNYDKYIEQLKGIKNQIGFKLAGYSDKDKIKLVLDSKTPLSKGNVFVPFENYDLVLRTSAPLQAIAYSGIIIEKRGTGYVISGYDKTSPQFKYYNFVESNYDPAVQVGGISEGFISWSENKLYTEGKIVEYQNQYYRVKIGHTSTQSFDATKFVKLPALPISGGTTAIVRKTFDRRTIQTLNYGTKLETKQDVVDFLLGYQQYLEDQGFLFEYFNQNTGVLENFDLSIKEFLFWTTQNWASNSIITLSPLANNLYFNKNYLIVDNINDQFYDFPVLDENGRGISDKFNNVYRDNADNLFSLQIEDSGIYFAKLPLVQKEHVVLIDNTTVFNDTIYDPEVGYRQERIKVVGYRTDNWNGSLNIPGFTFDEAKVTEWKSYKDYQIGELVKFKQFYYAAKSKHSGKENFDYNDWNRLPSKPQASLYPNWDYKSAQFTDFYDLDTDNFDSEQQRLAQHLIGYQKRDYLANIIQDDVSQYKFYQGFIQDKGTNNALTKLFDKLGSANQDSLEFYEEWAFRKAQYGALESFEEVEYQLDEKKFRLEPQLIELVNSEDVNRTDLVYEYKKSDVYVEPKNYNHSSFPAIYNEEEYSKTGGYVKLDQIDYIAGAKEEILGLSIDSVDVGMYIWIPKEQQSWNVYRHVVSPRRIIGITKTDEGFIATFDKPVDFQVGDIIGLNNINEQINNFWLIQDVSSNTVEIYSEDDIQENAIDLSDSTLGVVTEFSSRRVSTPEEINNIIKKYNFQDNERIWIDSNSEGRFEVLDNQPVYSLQQEYIGDAGSDFGASFAVNGNNTLMAVGAPKTGNGEVKVYARLSEQVDYQLLQTLVPNDRKVDITTFQNTTPVVITTKTPHNIQDGALIQINGLEGTLGTQVNGNFYTAASTGSNTIELYSQDTSTAIDGSLLSTYEGGGEIEVDLSYTDGAFGTGLAMTYDGAYLFVGAPTASNIRTRYVGEVSEGTTYAAGDIVSDRNTLWRALTAIDMDSSSVDLESQDWEPVKVLETDPYGEAIPFDNAGVVHIYKKQINNEYVLQSIICSPNMTADAKFGIGIKTSTPQDFLHTVYVRSLEDNGRLYFVENTAPQSDEFVYAVDTAYRGEFSEIHSYAVDEIVYYQGDMYKCVNRTFAGNAFNSNDWQQVSTDVDYLGFVPSNGDGDLLDDDSTGFGTSEDIARSFDSDLSGNILVVSAYMVDTNEYRVAVYRKNVSGRYVFDQNLDSPVNNESFGFTVAVSDDANRIAVSAESSDDNGKLNGKVYIYKQVNGEYVLDQEMYAPEGEVNEGFGNKIDFSNNKLAVYSLNGDTTAPLTLDSEQTILDNGATNLVDTEQNNGQIYIFELRSEKFVYAENMSYTRSTEFARPYIALNNNHYYLILKNLEVDSSEGLVANFKSERNSSAWTTNSVGEEHVKTQKLKGVFLYDKNTSDLVSYLDYVDPIHGKLLGVVEQELTYKLYYDPAVYNVGSTDTGSTNVWDSSNVGQLWWDMEAVRWFNPFQGDIQFKSNTWNSVIPGFSIDVYEWVESEYLPSEWDELSGTSQGIAEDITGTTKYGDDSYVTAKVYDPITGQFSEKYYYWVKDKETIPNTGNRKISCKSVASLIEDPASQGYRFITILDSKKFALHNVRSLIQDKNTILHFDYEVLDTIDFKQIHTEYSLLVEGLATSKPGDDLVNKWIDSLVGYDQNRIQLPSLEVKPARRYGILNEPMQSMFVNRIEALKQIVERVNSVFANNLIVDDFDLTELQRTEPLPSQYEGLYDTAIDYEGLLRFVGTAKLEQAKLTPTIVDGKITNVTITNAGRGYIDPSYVSGQRKGPAVEIVGTGTGAIIQTYINNLGQITSAEVVKQGKNYLDNTVLIVRPFTVLVKSDSTISGFWATYTYNKSEQTWQRQQIQSYDVSRYWQYVDWYADGYSENTEINYVVAGSFALEGLNNPIGSIVKIENVGSGGWLLLHKIDNQSNVDYTVNYQTIGRQNGTIKLSKLLYNDTDTGFDNQTYDAVFYDREATTETRIILHALKNDIFVDQLEVEWNKLFFSSVRYALAEQPTLDWVFKTSFVTAKHNFGELQQKVTYQNDNLPNYQDYVAEVKPYSTQIREYISSYEKIDPTQTSVTDFDLPPRYDAVQDKIVGETVRILNNELVDTNSGLYTYPQKHWTDNLGYEITDIVVFDGGSGYTDTATVTISGGGGPTLVGKGTLAGSSVNYIDVDTNGAKYTSTPIVSIDGTIDEDGSVARAVVILGNSKTRSTHIRMKFDRTSGVAYFDTLAEEATFVGTGSQTEFVVKWPIDTQRSKVTVVVDDVEALSATYTPSNKLDLSKGYDRYLGVITFDEAPKNGANIVVQYEKATSLLHAADRILMKYNPTVGMPGKELAQLMDGVDYGGVQIDTLSFGTFTGWDSGSFGLNFDTFDENYEDEIFVLDGSTQVLNLAKPLEAGVQYNVYKGRIGSNGAVTDQIRLDDPNYPSSPTNENAVMQPLVGDDITTTFYIDNDLIDTKENDVIIIRKSTSDGSFDTGNETFDVELGGGNFAYTTATGVDAGDIVVDGDGFVTETTSKGPEEQVPGQVLDAVDIRVYNRQSNGQGIINTKNYITDGQTLEYEFEFYPQSNTSIFVSLGAFVLDPDQIQIDWEAKTIAQADSTPFPAGQNLSITTIGTNGVDIIDVDKIVADGIEKQFSTSVRYTNNISAFVTINGVFQRQGAGSNTDYDLIEDDNGFVAFAFGPTPPADAIIDFTLYDGKIDQYSELTIDDTFIADGVNKVHRWDETIGNKPLPAKKKPYWQNMLVSVNTKFLNPGYTIKYTLTNDRNYDIDAWQFEDTTLVRNSDVFVYIDNVLTDRSNYTYDPVNGRVNLLKNNVGLAGQTMEIFIVRDAEYYFLDTVITITNGDAINDYSQGDIIEFRTTDDSTVVVATVEEFARNGTEVTIKLQGYVRDLQQIQSEDDTPPVIASSLVDSTEVVISNVQVVESNNLTLENAPAENSRIRLYTFNNHDINEFERKSYSVVYNTNRAPVGTQAYIDKNMLSRGFIKLSEKPLSADYVWVFRNGALLAPNVDYKLNAAMDGIQLLVLPNPTEKIEIFQFAASVSVPKFGFRIFKDILNRYHYKRLNSENEYELARDLNYYDKNIQLKSTANIPRPNRAIGQPGVININGERIEYYTVDGNFLRQIRRGTLGTGTPNVHPAGSQVLGQGPEETLPYKDQTYTTVFTGDDSTQSFVLDFTPTVNEFGTTNEAEIFVGGRRLRSVPLQSFDKTLDQDSPDADVTLPVEYTIENNVLTLAAIPASGVKVVISRMQGKTWTEDGTSMSDSNRQIAKFIREKTISLPR